jgi:DNA-binding MarR family transcriptional regulator
MTRARVFASPLSGDSAEERVADRLHSTAIHVLRRVARQDRLSGVGPARLSALSVVVYGGPLTLGALARAERVRSPTMTGIVQALEVDGLVRRTPGTADRRTVLIEATDRGRRLLDEARRRRVADLAALLRQLPRQELATVEAATTIVEAALARAVDADERGERPGIPP